MDELAVIQDSGVDPGLDLFDEIERLKKEQNAVLLAHYYQGRTSRILPISWAIAWSQS